MSWLWHWLARRLGTNTGRVVTWYYRERLMVGFRCDCGRLQGIHPALVRAPGEPQ